MSANNKLEILVNLIYLAKHSIDDPQKLIEYLEQAQIHVLEMAEILPDSPKPFLIRGGISRYAHRDAPAYSGGDRQQCDGDAVKNQERA